MKGRYEKGRLDNELNSVLTNKREKKGQKNYSTRRFEYKHAIQ